MIYPWQLIGRLELLDDELEEQIESLLDSLKDDKTGKTSLDSKLCDELPQQSETPTLNDEEKVTQTHTHTMADEYYIKFCMYSMQKGELILQKGSKNKLQPSQKRQKLDKNFDNEEEDPLDYYERVFRAEEKRGRRS